jgi:hypothetical protein
MEPKGPVQAYNMIALPSKGLQDCVALTDYINFFRSPNIARKQPLCKKELWTRSHN